MLLLENMDKLVNPKNLAAGSSNINYKNCKNLGFDEGSNQVLTNV